MSTQHFSRVNAGVKIAVLVVTGLLSLSAQASEALARKNDCMGCHAVATLLVGPAYKDVAAKYAGQADAQAMLVQSIRNGSMGKWGNLPMPTHPKLSEVDARSLAAWVLKAK